MDEEYTPTPMTLDDILKAEENISIQIDNVQEDVVRLGLIITVLLIVIAISLIAAMVHFWYGSFVYKFPLIICI